jgi:hypothetical protein
MLWAGGEPVAGSLGSFCWNDTCVDGPTAPKSTLPELTASESTLEFAMENGELIYEWYAHYSSGSNSAVTKLGGGCCWAPPDSPSRPPGLDQIQFPTPPPGDWVVHVSVWFEWGDAFYAWHVTVPD